MSGLFSGSIVGIILIVFADVRWFFVVLAFLVIGSISTRYRYEVKAAAGIAESHGGVRGYINVFANCLVGVAAAVLYGLSGGSVLPLALFLGSVATAAADTMGGEIGMTSRDPVLITSFEPVPKGTNGGITLLGEVASLGASAAIALSALLLGIGDLPAPSLRNPGRFRWLQCGQPGRSALREQGLCGKRGDEPHRHPLRRSRCPRPRHPRRLMKDRNRAFQ